MTKFKILLILLVGLSPSVVFAAAQDDFFESKYNDDLIANGRWFWEMKLDEILLSNDSNQPPSWNYSNIRFGPLSAGAWGGAYSAGKAWKYIIPPNNLTKETTITADYWLADEAGVEVPGSRAKLHVTFKSNAFVKAYTPPDAPFSTKYKYLGIVHPYDGDYRYTGPGKRYRYHYGPPGGKIWRMNTGKMTLSPGPNIYGYSDKSQAVDFTEPENSGYWTTGDMDKLIPTFMTVILNSNGTASPVTLPAVKGAPGGGTWMSVDKDSSTTKDRIIRVRIHATYQVPDDGQDYAVIATFPTVKQAELSMKPPHSLAFAGVWLELREKASTLDAIDDAYTGVKNKKLTMPVKSNDIGAEYATLTIATQPNEGTVSKATSDKLEFTPPKDWTGKTSFTYTITDGKNSDTATVTITIPEDEPSDEKCDPCEYLKRIAKALDPPEDGYGKGKGPDIVPPILNSGERKKLSFDQGLAPKFPLPKLDFSKTAAPKMNLYIPWVNGTTKSFELSPSLSAMSGHDPELAGKMDDFRKTFRFFIMAIGTIYMVRKIFTLGFFTV